MRKLVVFYSLSSNTRFIAENIAASIDADLLELKPKEDLSSKRFVMLRGVKQVMMKETPELERFPLDPSDYDVIFIGTPVWSYTQAPAVRSFIEKVDLKGKKLALFCCYGGNKGKTFERMREKLPGLEILGEIGFHDPVAGDGKKAVEAGKWALSIIERASV